MAYATGADVQAAYEATIPATLDTFIATHLQFANALLDVRVPTLAARVADDDALALLAKQVVVTAVLRVLRNPDGYRSETAGDYSYAYGNAAGSSGRVDFTAEELADLRPAGGRARLRSVSLDDDGLERPTRAAGLRRDVTTDGDGRIIVNYGQGPESLQDPW